MTNAKRNQYWFITYPVLRYNNVLKNSVRDISPSGRMHNLMILKINSTQTNVRKITFPVFLKCFLTFRGGGKQQSTVHKEK